MKKIVIKDCSYCPYIIGPLPQSDYKYSHKCRVQQKLFNLTKDIPNWCPLEDN